jgi:hypothetical protein
MLFACTFAAVAMLVAIPTPSAAQKKAEEKKSSAKKQTVKKEVVPDQPSVRMPAHFGKVVNDEQREKILDIQKVYMPQIDQKRAELQALLDKRDAACFALLSADQKRQVEELRAAAAAQRAAASQAADGDETDEAPASSKAKKSSK